MQGQKQSENPADLLESYEKKKVLAFKGLVASFIAWQLGQIVVNNFSEWLPTWSMWFFQLMLILGALGWTGFIFYLLKISQFLKSNSQLCQQVNDERLSLIRLRAMSYGFMFTLVASALLFAMTILLNAFGISFELSGAFVAQSIILVSVSSTFISYLVLDKDQ